MKQYTTEHPVYESGKKYMPGCIRTHLQTAHTVQNPHDSRYTVLRLAAFGLIMLMIAAVIWYAHSDVELVAYDMDGSPLGYIQNLSVLTQAKKETISEIYEKSGKDPALENAITVKSVIRLRPPKYLSRDDLKEYYKNHCGWNFCEAYVLTVDGSDIAACTEEGMIERVMRRAEQELTSKTAAVNGAVVSVEIDNTYSVSQKYCDASLLVDEEGLYQLLYPQQSAITELLNDAQNMAAVDGISPSEMTATNAASSGEVKISDSQEDIIKNLSAALGGDHAFVPVSIEDSKMTFAAEQKNVFSGFRYRFCEIVTEEVSTPYQIVECADATQYPYYNRVTTEGQNGLCYYVYEFYYIDGQPTQVSLLYSETKAEVIDEVRVRGTKPYTDPGVVTGSLILPLDGDAFYLTSKFQEYRAAFDGSASHYGIDIASPEGTPVYAADGGVVSFSDTAGTYGNMVLIDHNDGYQTCYAHMMSRTVAEGDEVYQGQIIGYVGQTGAVTAAHLHFEVRKDGVYQNPLFYIPTFTQLN